MHICLSLPKFGYFLRHDFASSFFISLHLYLHSVSCFILSRLLWQSLLFRKSILFTLFLAQNQNFLLCALHIAHSGCSHYFRNFKIYSFRSGGFLRNSFFEQKQLCYTNLKIFSLRRVFFDSVSLQSGLHQYRVCLPYEAS